MRNFLKTQKTSLAKIAYPGIVIWIATLFIAGCQSYGTVVIHDSSKPLPMLYQAVDYSLPGGIRKRSRNNRIFYGHYHPPGGNPRANAAGKINRAYGVISILNDKRPYDIKFKYIVEKYQDGEYFEVEDDEKQAKKMKKKFQNYLVSRPENRDLIDDFRPF